MLLFTLLVISASLISAKHLPPTDGVAFDCPFHNQHTGLRCLRDENMVPGVFSIEMSALNLRSDIPSKSASLSELASERFCCYELGCLKKCGIHNTIADLYGKRLLEAVEVAMEL